MLVSYCSSHSSRPFYDKRISAECSADSLGDEWKVSCCNLNHVFIKLCRRDISLKLEEGMINRGSL